MGTPRKIVVAVYCDNDEQAVAVQNIVKELCSTNQISASDLMCAFHWYKQHKGPLKDAVKTIRKEGKAGAIRLIPSIVKMFF